MPFPMRIQPTDSKRNNAVKPPVFKSRLMRLFNHSLGGALKLTTAAGDGAAIALSQFDLSTMSLDKMVRNFYEGSSERQSSAARRRCFNGNSNDSSGDEHVVSASANPSFADIFDALKFYITDPTTGYKAVLMRLLHVFVGKSDRLLQIVTVAAKAVRLSMRKAGMYLPPWRKLEYSKAKWLSSHTRIKQPKEEWQLPPLRPKVSTRRNKAVVAGLSPSSTRSFEK